MTFISIPGRTVRHVQASHPHSVNEEILMPGEVKWLLQKHLFSGPVHLETLEMPYWRSRVQATQQSLHQENSKQSFSHDPGEFCFVKNKNKNKNKKSGGRYLSQGLPANRLFAFTTYKLGDLGKLFTSVCFNVLGQKRNNSAYLIGLL